MLGVHRRPIPKPAPLLDGFSIQNVVDLLWAPLSRWPTSPSKARDKVQREMTHSAQKTAKDMLSLGYTRLHITLLDVSETNGMVSAGLFQKKEGGRRRLMYFSSKLEHIEMGQTGADKTAHIVMCHKLKINTQHGVVGFLTSAECNNHTPSPHPHWTRQ